MVLSVGMRNLIKYFFLILLSVVFSCEKMGLIVNCDECTASEPVDADLEVRLDYPYSTGYNTIVQVYEGIIEDNVLKSTQAVKVTELSVPVRLNKKYTLTATYVNTNGSTYITVGSATPRVRYNTDQCKDPCYYIYDKKIDLRLKYSK
jgi:hypothetical protein